MYWYVLFVRTGWEQRIEQFLKERLDTNLFIPFVPLQETIFKIAGKTKKELKPLFPSYVFIETEVSGQEFINRTSTLFYNSRNIVCILKYSDTEIALKESERQLLLKLCNDDYCIESSSGIIVGDKIYISDGPLKGYESLIRSVNRHKRLVWIEVEFMGEMRQISLALEIIKKIPDN